MYNPPCAPLVFSFGKISKAKMYLGSLITFALIGLWHGANWTYVIFGTLHGLYIVIEMMTEKIRKWFADSTYLTKVPRIHHAIQMAIVFMLVSFSFIFFRAKTFSEATYIIEKIFSNFSIHELNFLDTTAFATIIFSIILLFLFEYLVLEKKSMEEICTMRRGALFSSMIIVSSILLSLSFGLVGSKNFIYFQF